MAGFEVPPDTSIICAEIEGVGKQYPLSAEKLSPVLSLYFVKDFNAALDTCFALLKFGGMGHTAVIYAKNEPRTREFAMRMPAMRVLVNTPAPQGSTGITTNVFPSMTLGCGADGGQHHLRQRRPAAPDQHQAAGLHRAQARRGVRDAADLKRGWRPMPAATGGSGPIDRAAVVAAVERYLASRGIAVAAPAAPPAPAAACGCAHPDPAPPAVQRPSSLASPPRWWTAFWPARRRAPGSQSGSQKSGGYS